MVLRVRNHAERSGDLLSTIDLGRTGLRGPFCSSTHTHTLIGVLIDANHRASRRFGGKRPGSDRGDEPDPRRTQGRDAVAWGFDREPDIPEIRGADDSHGRLGHVSCLQTSRTTPVDRPRKPHRRAAVRYVLHALQLGVGVTAPGAFIRGPTDCGPSKRIRRGCLDAMPRKAARRGRQ